MNVTPAWILEIADYVNENIPDAPTPAYASATPTYSGVGMTIYPHVSECDQCQSDSSDVCMHCGAGLHSMAHSLRHIRHECQGEDYWLYLVV